MNYLIALNLIVGSILSSPAFSDNVVINCEKCEIKKVKAVAENINSLTYELTKDFFCTFDKSCQKNTEYSEWSNEIIFELLDNNANLFLTVLETESVETQQMLIEEIETPIHEFDLKRIHRRVETTKFEGTLKKEVLDAISIAKKKQ